VLRGLTDADFFRQGKNVDSQRCFPALVSACVKHGSPLKRRWRCEQEVYWTEKEGESHLECETTLSELRNHAASELRERRRK
jgi:hypothetical protein